MEESSLATYGLDARYSPKWVALAERYPTLGLDRRGDVARIAHLRPYLVDLVSRDPEPEVRRILARNPFVVGTPAHHRLLADTDGSVSMAAAQWTMGRLDLRQGLAASRWKGPITHAFMKRANLWAWAGLARRAEERRWTRNAERIRATFGL